MSANIYICTGRKKNTSAYSYTNKNLEKARQHIRMLARLIFFPKYLYFDIYNFIYE